MDLGLILRMFQSVERTRRRERWSRADLAAYQEDSLRRLREFAYAHSPFYRRFHAGRLDRPLGELPVLTKSMVMENFDELVTDRAIRLQDVRSHLAAAGERRLYLGRYWVASTSGSTGQPGLFLFSRAEWADILASFARAHEWAGLTVKLTHRMKMASVASTSPAHMSAMVGQSLQSWWMPALRLAATEPLGDIVDRLNQFQPEMLVAYASMARILAEEQVAGRLRIHPHLVFTSSEVLTEETRRRAEAAWGYAPFNQYAATETGGAAAECAQDRQMHLFEDLLIPEVVDEENRAVPAGTYAARLLVTVLSRWTQPLIRYELSDSLRLAEGISACGRPFATVGEIQGRTEDTLRLPGRRGASVEVNPLAFHNVLDAAPASGWQVVEEADGLQVLLAGVSNGAVEADVVKALNRALEDLGVVVPRITVRHVQAIPKSTAGKAPLIKSHRSPAR